MVERVRQAAAEVARLPMNVVTLGAPNVREVLRIARKYVAEKKASLIIVDYVQLIRNAIDNRVQDVTETTTALRGFALRHKVPVLLAAQLSRAIEQRSRQNGGVAPPQLSDLRESGSLEQDSTQVWFLREVGGEGYDPGIFPENRDGIVRSKPIRVHVSKNRNGPTGITEPVKWQMDTGRFYTLDRGTFQ